MSRKVGVLLILLILAACGGGADAPPAASATPEIPDPRVETAQPTATPAAPGPTAVPGGAPDLDDWAAVEQAARGQTVNWYLWGGSQSINA